MRTPCYGGLDCIGAIDTMEKDALQSQMRLSWGDTGTVPMTTERLNSSYKSKITFYSKRSL
jgi:hypothetical protein